MLFIIVEFKKVQLVGIFWINSDDALRQIQDKSSGIHRNVNFDKIVFGIQRLSIVPYFYLFYFSLLHVALRSVGFLFYLMKGVSL